MPRALPRLLPLALLALLTSCEGCLDGMDVSRLTAAFVVEPGAIERLQVWAGYPRTVTLRVKSQGAAPLLDLTASVRDAGGPAQVTARLDGDALAPGGELALFVVLHAPPSTAGLTTATIVVDAGADGRVEVPLAAIVAEPPSCDDGNPCTSDGFDPETGQCVRTTLPDGASCEDGSACTVNDRCLSGRCLGEAVHCDDGVECTADRCDARVGCVYEPMPSRCDDGDPCTADVCDGFFGCQNPPLAEGALCHFDGCNEIGLCFLGECVRTDVPDGMPCEDGDACTRNDTCQGGVCVPGEDAGLGAAPPLAFEPSATFELCRGLEASAGCYGVLEERTVERVLAVERKGQRLRLIWQGPYRESNGVRCDPTLPRYRPYHFEGGAGSAEPPPEQGEAQPPSAICAAGVFLTTLPLPGGIGAVSTTQLTVVRGPAAAAFFSGPTTAQLSPERPAEAPPVPLPPLLPEVVVAHPDYLRATVWVEQLSEHGETVLVNRRAPPGLDIRVAHVAIGADRQRAVVVVHDDSMERPADLCDAEGCEIRPLPLWVFGSPRYGYDGGFQTSVLLPRVIDEACFGVASLKTPVKLYELTVSLSETVPRVSFRMSRSVCGDVEPGTLGVPPDAPRPWKTSAWSFVVEAPSTPTASPLWEYPLFMYDDGSPVASFRTTPEGGAAALRHVPTPCPVCLDTGEGPPCPSPAPEQTCFDTVLERTLDVDGLTREELVHSLGQALEGQAVPLVVEGELRVVTLIGGSLELVGRGPGGDTARLVAPAPPNNLVWDGAAMLLPGPPESHFVVGRGVTAEVDALGLPQGGQALLQVFGCGYGEAATDDRCLEPEDCAAGLECDRSVCLPGPGCERNNACDLCWGRCTEPPAPDGGVLEADAGPDDDAGSDADAGMGEDAGLGDGNETELDGGSEADAG